MGDPDHYTKRAENRFRLVRRKKPGAQSVFLGPLDAWLKLLDL